MGITKVRLSLVIRKYTPGSAISSDRIQALVRFADVPDPPRPRAGLIIRCLRRLLSAVRRAAARPAIICRPASTLSNTAQIPAGVNEDLAATAIWGSQQLNLSPAAKYDGIVGIWYGK